MERGEIAPVEQFLLLSTIFCYLVLDFFVKTRIRFSLRDKQVFEITEVEIIRVDCKIRKLIKTMQSVGHLTRKSEALGSIPGLTTYFRFSFR